MRRGCGLRVAARKEAVEQAHKRLERLDIRHVAAGRQGVQGGPDEVGRDPSGLDRDRIVFAMEHDCGEPAEAGERGSGS